MGKPTFECPIPWDKGRTAQTLVIHCSAYDIRPYFTEFVDNHLKLKEYDLLALPGGVQILTFAHILPKVRGFFQRIVEFLIKHHDIKKIVILGHEDCAWYKDYRFGPIHLDLKSRQLTDLKEVATNLNQVMGVVVEIYFANIHDGKVTFTKMD